MARAIRSAVEARPATSPLLTKPSGDPWRSSDHTRPFTAVIERLRQAAATVSPVTTDRCRK